MDFIDEANKVYLSNFKPEAYFGRCIFLSWYCDVGTCKFCFRSTIKHKIKHAKNARRSVASVLCDALISKNLGWRLEFLTGGYRIFSFEDIVKIAKYVSEIYDERLWVNLGVLTEEELERLKPYVDGICASIETLNPVLHDKICPNKPIEPYVEMLEKAKNLKKSITVVIGLGEKKEDIDLLHDFIKENKLDRITFYALKPVKGTPYTESPDINYYAWWIANTRIKFPNLEIMAGLTPKRADYTELILRAGANGITKFPAIKQFNSENTRLIENAVKKAGRNLIGDLNNIPDIDWDYEINKLEIDKDLKNKIKFKLNQYLEVMRKSKN